MRRAPCLRHDLDVLSRSLKLRHAACIVRGDVSGDFALMARTPSNLWQPWKRHWLFIIGLFALGPACGYVLAGDRGLLFGLAIGVFASAWLLWSRHEREVK